MKMLLINPPIREWAKPNVFPLGLGYIASVLRGAGFDVEVMDINAHRWSRDEVEARIAAANFDVAGIGAIVTVYSYVKWLIDIIKKQHPDKKIVVGGSVGTSIPHIILEKTAADIVCMGEGETTAVELMHTIQREGDLRDVDGIWFKNKEGEIIRNRKRRPIGNLDTLPWCQR